MSKQASVSPTAFQTINVAIYCWLPFAKTMQSSSFPTKNKKKKRLGLDLQYINEYQIFLYSCILTFNELKPAHLKNIWDYLHMKKKIMIKIVKNVISWKYFDCKN